MMTAPQNKKEVQPLTPEQKELVEANLGLVYQIARRLCKSIGVVRAMGLDEAIQDGAMAMAQCAVNYNTERKVAFSTYAWVAVRRRILKRAFGRAVATLSLDALSGLARKRAEPVAPEPEEEQSDNELIEQALEECLDGANRQVIRMYFGIGCQPMHMRIIARIYHVSHQRIHDRVKRSLKKLRDWFEREEES